MQITAANDFLQNLPESTMIVSLDLALRKSLDQCSSSNSKGQAARLSESGIRQNPAGIAVTSDGTNCLPDNLDILRRIAPAATVPSGMDKASLSVPP